MAPVAKARFLEPGSQPEAWLATCALQKSSLLQSPPRDELDCVDFKLGNTAGKGRRGSMTSDIPPIELVADVEALIA